MLRTSKIIRLKPRDAIYEAVKRRILLNDLRPGTTLTELGLAEEMGCSQGPVREALLRLQEDGLVSRNGHRGTIVTPLDAATALEMLALRRQIEMRGARAGAAHIDPETIEKLTELRAEMDECARLGDEFGMVDCDIRFHLALFRTAGFQALESILIRVMLHTHRQKLWEPRHRRPLAETAARHDAILTAVPLGGAALAQALGDHIDTIVDIGAVAANQSAASAEGTAPAFSDSARSNQLGEKS